MPKTNPVVAICATRRAAAEAAALIRRAGVGVRKLSIVERDYPTGEAAARIAQWPALMPAWVSEGCLNAIGGGLGCLGIPDAALRRCRGALAAARVLIVVQGTPEEIVRARKACRSVSVPTGP